jgi:hypothetical protein
MNDANYRLLANALLDELFVLLLESCAPLWNCTFTYKYIINSNQSFIGVFDDLGSVGRGRCDARMAPYPWRKEAQWFEVN